MSDAAGAAAADVDIRILGGSDMSARCQSAAAGEVRWHQLLELGASLQFGRTQWLSLLSTWQVAPQVRSGSPNGRGLKQSQATSKKLKVEIAR